ncbi:DUF1217 domain-containing protein [Roseomonas rosulenta]|uniref:DUF1217 domain-containing protein n=1 Tax=Roseomonas rosulenta TaxID=2748667 RepID=UPI0018DFEB3A|nr:DUF1217 domain-containing protein [Roseomonas rosulenta]
MALTLTQVRSLFGAQAEAGGTGNAAMAIPALRRATAAGAEAKGIARETKDPVTLTALAQFRVALDKAGSIEQALQDPRILKVVMPALGLPDQAGNPGLVRRALLSDPADAKGLAAQLGATWKAAAATLGVHATGLDGLRDPAMVQRLSDAFLKYQYRSGLDEEQAGLSDALYFLEAARTAEDVFDVLGDPVLRRVVTGALGLPDQLAVQSVEAQGRAVTSRLKVATLQDDRAVRKLAERYLIAAANSAGAAAAATDPMAMLTALSVRA